MKTYDEIAKNALVRRDEYIKTKRKKIKITACACCVAFVALAGLGVWKSGFFATRPLQGEETSAPTTVEPTLTPADPDNSIACGGEDYGWFNAYSDVLYSINSGLIDYIKEECNVDYVQWSESRKPLILATKYDLSDPECLPSLSEVIKIFNVPEQIIKDEYGFSDEEIDALYSGDLKDISRVFPADNAIIHNGRAFAPKWYLNATDEELARYGISRKTVTDKAISFVCNSAGGYLRHMAFITYFKGGFISGIKQASPKYYSPELYDTVIWTNTQAAEYFGKDFSALSFMPDNLSFNGNYVHKIIFDKNVNIEKDSCYFRYDNGESGCVVTLSVSKTGLPYDCVYVSEQNVEAVQLVSSGVDVRFYLDSVGKDTANRLCVADFEKDGIYYRLEAEYLEFDKFCNILIGIINL